MRTRQGFAALPLGGRSALSVVFTLEAVILGIAFLGLAGCGQSKPAASSKPGQEATAAPDAQEGITAVEILKKSAAAYTAAKSYRDEGELVVQFPGAAEPSRFPFSISFSRPDSRVRIEAYQVTLASDGKRMRGFIEDTLSNNLDQQFLDSPAPQKLIPETVISDPEAAAILSQGAGGPPPVLEWLLSKAPFGEILNSPERLSKLPSRAVGGETYYRVRIDLKSGQQPLQNKVNQVQLENGANEQIVLWINQSSWLVGRLEYPKVSSDPAGQPSADNLISITADLRNAALNEKIEDGQFVLTPTPSAKVVGFFVPPPPPIPLDRLGKKPASFELDKLDGGKLASDEFLGKTAVLLFVRNHPACEDAAKQLVEVYKSFKEDPRFAFHVVVNESREVSNPNIVAMLDQWGISIPASRDHGQATGDALAIASLPTLLIFDPVGRLQLSQSYGFASLAATLPAVCEQIAAGEDIFQRLLDGQKQYEDRLAIAKSGGKSMPLGLTPTKIAPAREPKRLKLRTEWELPELSSIACLLTSDVDGELRLLALESPRTVNVISPNGKALGKLELKAPEGASFSVLRTAPGNENGSAFCAFTPGGEAAYFFDSKGALLGVFPPAGQPHEGVADVLITDLDGKPGIEAFVGFSALLGVQATDLKGERAWRNLAIPSVISLASGPKNVAGWRKLFATDDRGRIIMLNQFGKHEFIELEDREIHRLFHRRLGDEQSEPGDAIFCGISFQEQDKLLAIGFDSDFTEAWTYQLPPGVFVGPVQYAASIEMPNSKQVLWLLAAPDGSIHCIGSRGEFVDSFCTGERILALTTMFTDNRPTLIYATATGIRAQSFELPQTEAVAQ
jgi:hypothetical protein